MLSNGALSHSPVSVRDVLHLGLEAVSVVALVTAVAEQKFVLIVSAVAELAVLNRAQHRHESVNNTKPMFPVI